MYAEDTTLICYIDNTVTKDIINSELFKIRVVGNLGANNLSLNVSKAKFMICLTLNRSVKHWSLLIYGKLIERVT